MSARSEWHGERQPSLRPAELAVVPCAARPSTAFVHLDGPCRCFVGGPPPEFGRPMVADLRIDSLTERRAG